MIKELIFFGDPPLPRPLRSWMRHPNFHDLDYDELAAKFAEHFLWIAHAMNRIEPDGMWDEEDGFYYDVLRLPDESASRLKVRSIVGLLPLCATTVVEPWQRERLPYTTARYFARLRRMPHLRQDIHPTGPGHYGVAERGIIALVRPDRLRRILSRVLDENEFLSPYGIRALSRYHAGHPYVVRVQARNSGWTTCRRNRTPACPAAIPTGGGPSGCLSM
jgi:hypothetical protein